MNKSPIILEKTFHQQCLDIIIVSFKEEEMQVTHWILEFMFFLLSCTVECYYNEKEDLKEDEKNIIEENMINTIKEENMDNMKEGKDIKLNNENDTNISFSGDFIESNNNNNKS